ncbi:TPA: hypothetical protein NJ564_004598 [Vibrio parahaemolyticus]|nr:hypothetical protein [Vibrio parahaemolyticus]
MDISHLDKVLSNNGYEFDLSNDKFVVKLGGFANKVKISWDISRQSYCYSYSQKITPFLATFFGVFTVYNVMEGDQIGAILKAAISIMFFLMTVITELKVIELRNLVRKSHLETIERSDT